MIDVKQSCSSRLTKFGRIIACRKAGAAVEFAIVGVAFFAFIMAILNLGLVGFSLGAVARGTQAAGRAAAVKAAANYASTGTFTCPAPAAIAGYFNNAVSPPLPVSGTSSTASNPYINAVWTNNNAAAAGEPPGVYLTLITTYNWHPVGFNFGSGITLKIATVATAPGSSAVSSSAIDASC
jgi:Flp pilus assembly protein TadG